MASEWWWFLVLNAIVAAIAVLSMARPPSSPRGSGITRRTSSAVLQRLRSSLFSFPSAGFHAAPAPLAQPEAAVSQVPEEAAEATPPVKSVSTLRALAATPPPTEMGARAPRPEAAAATVSRETEEPAETPPATKPVSTPRAFAATPPPAKEEVVEEKGEPNAMSMEEAYALVQAARRRPERDEATRRSSDVDAKAEEFIQGFKENLRQQRLNSIFNYTQMLKKRAFGDGRRPPAAVQPDKR